MTSTNPKANHIMRKKYYKKLITGMYCFNSTKQTPLHIAHKNKYLIKRIKYIESDNNTGQIKKSDNEEENDG